MAHVNSLPDSTWKLTLSAVWDQIVLHHSVTMVAVVVFLLCPADLCSCIEFEGPIGQRWVANSPWHGHSWYLYTAPSVGPLQSLPNWVLSRWEQTTLQSDMIGGWSYGSWVLANATPLVLITSRFYRNHGHIQWESSRPNFAGHNDLMVDPLSASRCDTKPWKWEATVHIVLYVLHLLANHPKNEMFLFHNSEPYRSCHRFINPQGIISFYSMQAEKPSVAAMASS